MRGVIAHNPPFRTTPSFRYKAESCHIYEIPFQARNDDALNTQEYFMNDPFAETISLYEIIQGNDPIRGTFMRYLLKIADFQGVFNIESNNFPVDSLSNLRQIVSVTFAVSRYYMPNIKRGNIFMRDNIPFMIGTVQFLYARKTHCKCVCYSTELSLTV